MKTVKGLFFDVGGTVFDWKNTARKEIQELAGKGNAAIDSEAFANDWRRGMFKIRKKTICRKLSARPPKPILMSRHGIS